MHRQGRWCKGETSGNFITVHRLYVDCDRDSVIYMSTPKGPSCHTVTLNLAFRHLLVDCTSSIPSSLLAKSVKAQ